MLNPDKMSGLKLGPCICSNERSYNSNGVTSYIWHSTDVRAEWPPLSALPGIRLAPLFFNKKYMTDPIFLDLNVKGPTFLTPR